MASPEESRCCRSAACLSSGTSVPKAVSWREVMRTCDDDVAFRDTGTREKSLLQSHTDKRSFIVYLWTVCTVIISDRRLISCNKNLYYLGNERP